MKFWTLCLGFGLQAYGEELARAIEADDEKGILGWLDFLIEDWVMYWGMDEKQREWIDKLLWWSVRV